MALPNPTINPPRLASTAPKSTAAGAGAGSIPHSHSHSRSPSRSPVHPQHDPFLRSLSPTKTLRAFSSPRPHDTIHGDAVTKSIQDATHSQRALGAKVAQACADLRAWTKELEGWHWPGTFDAPALEPKRKKLRVDATAALSGTRSEEQDQDGDQDQDGGSGSGSGSGEEEFWGSLPVHQIHTHETRLEEICVDFDNIDFEELKSFVLSAHNQAGGGGGGGSGDAAISMDDSIGAIGAATDLKRLDDFTAIITATILQALPYLPRLTALLETWTTRLAILRAAPRYLHDLGKARRDLDRGWVKLAVQPSAKNGNANANHARASLSPESLEEMKSLISSQIYSLGKRLDRFLDMLEGRREVVPDAWIDDFEELEAEYGEWVVKAERKVLEGEWRAMKESVRETALRVARGEDESREVEDVVDGAEEGGVRDAAMSASNGTYIPTGINATATSEAAGKAAPASFATSSKAPPPVLPPPSNPSPTSSRKESSSPTRPPRHVPILVPYTHPDQPSETSSIVSSTTSTSKAVDNSTPTTPTPTTPLTRTKSKTPSETAPGNNIVKQRAAFLNGDIEKSESLLKSKSAPIVRPFEHASNAFTRLFKRENHDTLAAPEVAQSKQVRNRSVDEGSRQTTITTPTTTRDAGDDEEDSGRMASVSSSLVSGLAASDISTSASVSGSGSGSGSASGSKNYKKKKMANMEYMDMVRAPSAEPPRPKSREKVGRGREKDRKEDVVSPPSSARERNEGEGKGTVGWTDAGAEEGGGGEVKGVITSMAWGGVEVRPARSMGDVKKGKMESLDLVGGGGGGSSGRRRSFDDDEGNTTRSWKSTTTHSKKGSREITASPSSRTTSRTPTPSKTPKSRSADMPEAYRPDTRSPSSPAKKTSNNTPATYRPSGLSAEPVFQTSDHVFDPAEQDDFPPNWPLSASVTPSGGSPVTSTEYLPASESESASGVARELKDENYPLRSSDFEDSFVRNFSGRPRLIPPQQQQQQKKASASTAAAAAAVERPSSAPGFRSLQEQKVMVSDRAMMMMKSAAAAGGSGKGRARPVSVVEEEDVYADVEDGGENGEFRGGDRGEEESNSMAALAYFGNQSLKRSKSSPLVDATRTSPLKLAIPESSGEQRGEEVVATTRSSLPVDAAALNGDGRVRSASVASIEAHSRDELRSIEIGRGGLDADVDAIESGVEEPQTPKPRESTEEDNSPLNYNDMDFPSPPPSVPTRGSSLRSSMSSIKSDSLSFAKQRLSASSPLADMDEGQEAPLNATVPKQRKQQPRRSRGSIGENPPTSPEKTKRGITRVNSGEDNFDRHVSEVLDRVRAPIKFKARPGAITPVASGKAVLEQRMKARAERQGKNMTLAPAESSSPGKSTGAAADPEVKLYHLTQVGRSEPIKLYVRLVGEGERVMVRVGGGWADLADYLRQYAEHHGSRTVSEGLLELQTASAPGSANASGGGGGGGIGGKTRAVSGPAVIAPSELKPRTPNLVTPTLGRGYITTSPVENKPDPWGVMRHGGNKPRLWLGDDSGEEEEGDDYCDDGGQPSPTLPRQQYSYEARPISRTNNNNNTASRPSTADAFTRSESRQAGLMDNNNNSSSSPIGPGLDGKVRTDLPEQKARWVEGMIEKAMKSASAASASAEKEKEKAFGDMGKVGGTRRVVFRSASRAEGAK